MRHFIFATLLTLTLFTCTAIAVDWPCFRGTDQGRSSVSNVPTTWSDQDGKQENIAWKLGLPGRAWASPVVAEGKVWLANATKDGLKMSLVTVDLATGKLLSNQVIFTNDKITQETIAMNTYASPTAVLDPANHHIFLHYGTYGTACYDTRTNKKVWERRDINCDHFRGAGSSPMFADGKLVLHLDGIDKQYVTALDGKTGKTLWTTDRSVDFKGADGDFRKAYSTPLYVEENGEKLVLSSGAYASYAYALDNGKEVWRFEYPPGYSNTVMPLFDATTFYLNSGFGKPVLHAIKRGGTGNITDSHSLWSYSKAMPKKPTPVLVSGKIFSIGDRGVLACLDAKSGELVWSARVKGNYSSSPIATPNHLYISSHEGSTTVFDLKEALTAKKAPEPVAVNQLDADIMATPAVIDGGLIIRTENSLYRIEKK